MSSKTLGLRVRSETFASEQYMRIDMKKKWIIYFLIGMGITFFIANMLNSANADKSDQEDHTQVNQVPIFTQDKPYIMLTKQQPEFILKLKSNPTTGYSWFLREYDQHLVIPIKQEYQQGKQKLLIGAPGAELWTFKMNQNAFLVPQQTVLRFVYVRPWQSNDSATELLVYVTTKS